LEDAPARMAANTESSSNMVKTSTAAVGTARAELADGLDAVQLGHL
jgi:hypothetical protein